MLLIGLLGQLANMIAIALGTATTAIIIALIIYYSIANEYVPSNNLLEPPVQSSDLTIVLKRESTVLVPVRNILEPKESQLQALIYHNRPNINVTNVKLSTTADSILSYYKDFEYNGNFSKLQIYDTTVSARHDGSVTNSTNPYSVDIIYINGTKQLNRERVSFDWPIKTMDFPTLTYFMIVLVGIFASKISSYVLIDPAKKNALVGAKGVLWLAVGPILALLIFSNFERQVNLTSHLITNISLAFGFGFGIDKLAETGYKLITK